MLLFLSKGKAVCMPKKTPSFIIEFVLRKSSRVQFSGSATITIPALLTSISKPPKNSSTFLMAKFQSSGFETSSLIDLAFSPIASASVLTRSSSISVNRTLAPSSASIFASASPRPIAAPVTRATLPSSFFITFLR